MFSAFIFIAALIPVYTIFKVKHFKVVKFTRLLIPIFCITFVIFLILLSKTAIKAASKGLELWFTVVVPSLFPFFVTAELLSRTGFVKAFGILLEPIMRPLFNVPGSGSFAFAMGITSGYPVGAKITSQMRQDNLISKTEGERLLTFTNNSGPLFIFGAVSVGMFDMANFGWLLFLSHAAACITVGFIFKFYKRNKAEKSHYKSAHLLKRFKQELMIGARKNQNFGQNLGESLMNSVKTLVLIGGFIVLYSVILNILIEMGLIDWIASSLAWVFKLFNVGKSMVYSMISGFFEITIGCNLASKATGAMLIQKLTVVSLLLGWGGLSVHTQVLTIINKTDLSIKPYLVGKLLQGIISAFYTYIALQYIVPSMVEPKPIFVSKSVLSWEQFLNSSLLLLILCILILTTVSILSLLLNKTKKQQI